MNKLFIFVALSACCALAEAQDIKGTGTDSVKSVKSVGVGICTLFNNGIVLIYKDVRGKNVYRVSLESNIEDKDKPVSAVVRNNRYSVSVTDSSVSNNRKLLNVGLERRLNPKAICTFYYGGGITGGFMQTTKNKTNTYYESWDDSSVYRINYSKATLDRNNSMLVGLHAFCGFNMTMYKRLNLSTEFKMTMQYQQGIKNDIKAFDFFGDFGITAHYLLIFKHSKSQLNMR